MNFLTNLILIYLGGSYVKLEAEFLNQMAQINKCKTAVPTKGSIRAKSSK